MSAVTDMLANSFQDLPRHIRDVVVAGMKRIVQQDLMVEKMQAVVQELESSISDIAVALPGSQGDNPSMDEEDMSMCPPSPVPSSPKLDSNVETSYNDRPNPATPAPLCA